MKLLRRNIIMSLILVLCFSFSSIFMVTPSTSYAYGDGDVEVGPGDPDEPEKPDPDPDPEKPDPEKPDPEKPDPDPDQTDQEVEQEKEQEKRKEEMNKLTSNNEFDDPRINKALRLIDSDVLKLLNDKKVSVELIKGPITQHKDYAEFKDKDKVIIDNEGNEKTVSWNDEIIGNEPGKPIVINVDKLETQDIVLNEVGKRVFDLNLKQNSELLSNFAHRLSKLSIPGKRFVFSKELLDKGIDLNNIDRDIDSYQRTFSKSFSIYYGHNETRDLLRTYDNSIYRLFKFYYDNLITDKQDLYDDAKSRMDNLLSKLNIEGTIIDTQSAEEVNSTVFKGWEPPYKENTPVYTIELDKPITLSRVYSPPENSKFGSWFLAKKDIIGLKPEEMKDRFALPNKLLPEYVCDVTFKEGDKLRIGIVKEQPSFSDNSGGIGGAIQFDSSQKLNPGYIGDFQNEFRLEEDEPFGQ
ncbi:MAG: hypothetical protein N4A50_14155 [Vallitalea sp.]|jgi:hypothetical protein|nr:hypothetical protein [Vallitalea sp.]